MLYVTCEYDTDPIKRIQQRSNTVIYRADDVTGAVRDALASARNDERVLVATVHDGDRLIQCRRYRGDYEGCALGDYEHNCAESLAAALADFRGNDAVFDCNGELVAVVRGR